jgi:hypothetical protein
MGVALPFRASGTLLEVSWLEGVVSSERAKTMVVPFQAMRRFIRKSRESGLGLDLPAVSLVECLADFALIDAVQRGVLPMNCGLGNLSAVVLSHLY